jgi:hypothetical protein
MVTFFLLVTDDLACKLRVDKESLLPGDLEMLVAEVHASGDLTYWMCPDERVDMRYWVTANDTATILAILCLLMS